MLGSRQQIGIQIIGGVEAEVEWGVDELVVDDAWGCDGGPARPRRTQPPKRLPQPRHRTQVQQSVHLFGLIITRLRGALPPLLWGAPHSSLSAGVEGTAILFALLCDVLMVDFPLDERAVVDC